MSGSRAWVGGGENHLVYDEGTILHKAPWPNATPLPQAITIEMFSAL